MVLTLFLKSLTVERLVELQASLAEKTSLLSRVAQRIQTRSNESTIPLGNAKDKLLRLFLS